MQQKNPNRKQSKRIKRAKILLSLIICIFILINLYLLDKIVFHKKEPFISPLSNLGYNKNTLFESKLKKLRIDYSALRTGGSLYTFNIKGEGTVVMTEEKNIDQQLSSLQLILRDLKIKGIRFKSLDFRYDKPVITE